VTEACLGTSDRHPAELGIKDRVAAFHYKSPELPVIIISQYFIGGGATPTWSIVCSSDLERLLCHCVPRNDRLLRTSLVRGGVALSHRTCSGMRHAIVQAKRDNLIARFGIQQDVDKDGTLSFN